MQRSPPVSPRQMKLNLTSGRNLPAQQLPEWVRNDDKYLAFLNGLLTRVAKRCKDVFGACFINKILEIEPQLDGKTVQAQFMAGKDDLDPVAQVSHCLAAGSRARLVAIVVWWQIQEKIIEDDWAHAELLVFNKVHKTIELYDSNGSEFVKTYLPQYKQVLTKLFEVYQWPVQEYTFVPINWTNSPLGLQTYESTATAGTCYDVGGFCATWVFYYAELRAQNAADSPRTFRRRMKRRIETLAAMGIHLPEYFRDLLLDYLLEASMPRK